MHTEHAFIQTNRHLLPRSESIENDVLTLTNNWHNQVVGVVSVERV